MIREAMTITVFSRQSLLGSRLERLNHIPRPPTEAQIGPASIGHSTLPQLPLTWALLIFLPVSLLMHLVNSCKTQTITQMRPYLRRNHKA